MNESFRIILKHCLLLRCHPYAILCPVKTLTLVIICIKLVSGNLMNTSIRNK